MNKWFRTWFPPKEKSEDQIYKERKEIFLEDLDTRQHIFHENLRGASWTEVVLVLEARIYALEQELKQEKSKNIPILTDIVVPEKKPRRPRVTKPPKTP